MLKPYHQIRFHVAYSAQRAATDRHGNMTGHMVTVNEPLPAPRPRARAMQAKDGAGKVITKTRKNPWWRCPGCKQMQNPPMPQYVAQVYNPEEEVEPWMNAVRRAASSFLGATPWDYPAKVDVDWFFDPPQALAKVCKHGYVPLVVRPDRDNLDKSTLEALVQARLLFDDSPVWHGTIAKWYTTGITDHQPVLLPEPMATCDAFDAIDYRTVPGAIIRVRLYQWEQLGLKKPTRHGKPEAL